MNWDLTCADDSSNTLSSSQHFIRRPADEIPSHFPYLSPRVSVVKLVSPLFFRCRDGGSTICDHFENRESLGDLFGFRGGVWVVGGRG